VSCMHAYIHLHACTHLQDGLQRMTEELEERRQKAKKFSRRRQVPAVLACSILHPMRYGLDYYCEHYIAENATAETAECNRVWHADVG
jgi:hypothetical protein